MPDLEKQAILQEEKQDAELPRWAGTATTSWVPTRSVEDWTNFSCVALNTVATVSIVFANKM